MSEDETLLSQDIAALKDTFNRHNNGCEINTEGMTFVISTLAHMQRKAMRLEMSAKRWAGLAQREHEETQATRAAVTAKDDKVVLFPIIPRPVFRGSDPKGAA